jgi:hypothetical protein
MPEGFGFIIVRNVQSAHYDEYWKECIRCIRLLYTEPIIVFDTGSNAELITEFNATNVTVVHAKQPGNAIYGAYLYFLDTHPFEKAMILHDSAFIKQRIPFDKIQTVKFLWDFEHTWNKPENELRLIHSLQNAPTVKALYETQSKWKGCLGSISIIQHVFLQKLDEKYGFRNLDTVITEWKDWLAFERVFAVLCHLEESELAIKPSLFGNIHKFSVPFGFPYEK